MRPAPDEPTYRPGIALAAWAVAFLVSNLGSILLLDALGYGGVTSTDQLPIWVIAILQVPLWLGLTGGVVVVSRTWGTRSLRRDYGFAFAPVDLLGVPIGILVQLVFVPLLYKLLPFIDTKSVEEPAKNLTERATGWGVVLLVVLVVVGAPIVEELFFRGLLMRSIQARFSDGIALAGSSVLFALAHFQTTTVPALILFGLVAGYLAQRTRRLGMSIFAHAGFNATTVVALLLTR